jgi:UrcA family protein
MVEAYSVQTLLKVACIAAIVLPALPVAQAAAAEPHGIQVMVHYADLDITHPEGARALLSRLDFASMKACGGMPDFLNFAAQRAFKACMKDTMDRAVASAGSSYVAGFYGTPDARTAAR